MSLHCSHSLSLLLSIALRVKGKVQGPPIPDLHNFIYCSPHMQAAPAHHTPCMLPTQSCSVVLPPARMLSLHTYLVHLGACKGNDGGSANYFSIFNKKVMEIILLFMIREQSHYNTILAQSKET